MFSDISVEYVDHMGGDHSISNSARVSFAKWKDDFDEKDEKLIGFLGKHQHMTPFRHNQIQIRCKAPVFLARQLMKHQAGLTWNEVSRRYVDDGFEFYKPKGWRSRPSDGIKQGSGETIDEAELEWTDPTSEYHQALKACVDAYEDMVFHCNVAPEMARMVLPQSMMVEWIWTGNLLAFSHIYNLRAGGGAQQEAQVFAHKLKETIEPLFPVGWKALEDVKE